MSTHGQMFDWMTFPDGRARFSGIKRGWDEQGHVTFALEVNETEHFGEIDQLFLPDAHNFNLEVISFGYGRGEDVGMPGAATAFTQEELGVAKRLIENLVTAGLNLERPPNILAQTDKSRFFGEILFREGWALVKSGETSP